MQARSERSSLGAPRYSCRQESHSWSTVGEQHPSRGGWLLAAEELQLQMVSAGTSTVTRTETDPQLSDLPAAHGCITLCYHLLTDSVDLRAGNMIGTQLCVVAQHQAQPGL